jgi:hypothetical protein
MPLKTFWSVESASIQIEDITEEPESKLADFLRRILSPAADFLARAARLFTINNPKPR